jgi:hypothetical protein
MVAQTPPDKTSRKKYAEIKGPYLQKSIKDRIRALFLDNIGRIVTREQILEVAKDPQTGRTPENWHQRLSELRTDEGYTILSQRNRGDLRVSEYLMPTAERRPTALGRVKIHPDTWQDVLRRANYRCEWQEGDTVCGLREGNIDPVGGGRVKLTPDHKRPHAIDPRSDPEDPNAWQALCGRHQVIKKNYWDHTTGWLNVYESSRQPPKKRKEEFTNSSKTTSGMHRKRG